MLLLLIIVFLLLMILGMDVFWALSISSAIYIIAGGLGLDFLVIIPQRMVASLNHYTLLAIPLFILAGEIMNAGGITKRLIIFSKALIGHIRGGLSFVTIITNVIMAGVSGSALADASATGIVLIPAMKKDGYDSSYAAAVVGAGAIIGPIIPPSILMVIYGVQAEVSIGRLFLGGAVPGLLMGLFSFILCYVIAKKRNYPMADRVGLKEKLIATKDAFFALLMPVIILGGLVGGFVTPTETAVLAVVYAFIVGTIVFGELRLREIPSLLSKAGNMAAKVMIIQAAAGIFGYLLAEQQTADQLIVFIEPLTQNPIMILLLIVSFLLILGMFLDPIPAVIIFTPVFLPLITKLGIDPVFFGVLIVITLMIGALTPPVGMTLFLVSTLSQDTVYSVTKQLLPFIFAYALLVVILVFLPGIVLFLPKLLMG